MSWLTPFKFCLRNRRITGEDPQGGHAPPGSEMFATICPHLAWTCQLNQRGRSEPTFLMDVNEAWLYAPIVVHADIGLRCSSNRRGISVKALKGTRSTNHNQWPGLILSLSTTELLMEGALLPLSWLSDASTRNHKRKSNKNYRKSKIC